MKKVVAGRESHGDQSTVRTSNAGKFEEPSSGKSASPFCRLLIGPGYNTRPPGLGAVRGESARQGAAWHNDNENENENIHRQRSHLAVLT